MEPLGRLRLAVPVVPLRLVSHRVLRALAVVGAALPDARLSVWVAPEMFRVLGVGLLVPNLSPGMPAEFARSTAAGDSLTALLAALAFIGLRGGRRRGLAWACTVVGSLDLLIAFPHAAATGAISHMAAPVVCPGLRGPGSRHLPRRVLRPTSRGGTARSTIHGSSSGAEAWLPSPHDATRVSRFHHGLPHSKSAPAAWRHRSTTSPTS